MKWKVVLNINGNLTFNGIFTIQINHSSTLKILIYITHIRYLYYNVRHDKATFNYNILTTKCHVINHITYRHGLSQIPIHSEASLIGCQYTRSSTITYNLTSTDTYTQILCESGDTGMCGTGSAIQYVNISILDKFHNKSACECFLFPSSISTPVKVNCQNRRVRNSIMHCP